MCPGKDRACVGSLIFLRNIIVVPIDEEVALARSLVSADLETVFSSEEEFINHHKRRAERAVPEESTTP